MQTVLRWLLLAVLPSLTFVSAAAAERAGTPRPLAPRGELSMEERAVIGLFERARDTVVFITTREQVRDFWTRNVFSVPRGTGSGFIWDEGGHVVTNFHVIQGASEATVKLADGSDHKASLVGVSPAHDLAVLKIGAGRRLPPPCRWAAATTCKVGQKVFAIGNPFGLDWTLTKRHHLGARPLAGRRHRPHHRAPDPDRRGHQSGQLGRPAARLGRPPDRHQHGDLQPERGERRHRLRRAGGHRQPRGAAHHSPRQVQPPGDGHRTRRGLNQRLTAAFETKGVVILRVKPGSPAAGAGLQGVTMTRKGIVPGDIITAVDGKPVDSVGKFAARLDEYKPGDRIRLTLLRQGRSAEATITLQPGE
jgi:S1-C subfamily serine protease